MKTSLKLIGALLVTLTIALSSREAHALGPVGIEVGLRVGDGTNPSGNNSGVNPFGVGFGGRAGITLFNIYAGVDIMDYIGSGDGLGGTYHALQYGGTIGYGIGISVLTIRPQIGLGNISLSGSSSPDYPSASSFYLEPGALAMITIGWFFFGADINALFITSEPAYGSGGSINTSTNWPVSVTIHGQVGVSF
ncbi:MAG: hypothetical protein ACLQVI_32460 [Polyangiaceae bacterium]|jgi:hypothetical protein